MRCASAELARQMRCERVARIAAGMCSAGSAAALSRPAVIQAKLAG